MQDRSLSSNSTPRYFFDRVTDITPFDIKAMGGKAVAVDIDNTTAYDCTFILFKGVKQWIRNMQNNGIPVVILTNTNKARAKIMAVQMGRLPCVGSAKKPDKKAFVHAARLAGVSLPELVMIGDQLFTDIQGANNAGCISVRVHWVAREILVAFRYIKLRKDENRYLIHAGYADKI